MKIKTINLVGKQLNYAVAVSEGFRPFTDSISWIIDCKGTYKTLPGYSTDWVVAGPIIQRETITIVCAQGPYSKKLGGHIPYWIAVDTAQVASDIYGPQGDDYGKSFIIEDYAVKGSTPLEAAMRRYVSSKLGDEVEIPGELL